MIATEMTNGDKRRQTTTNDDKRRQTTKHISLPGTTNNDTNSGPVQTIHKDFIDMVRCDVLQRQDNCTQKPAKHGY